MVGQRIGYVRVSMLAQYEKRQFESQGLDSAGRPRTEKTVRVRY